MVKKKKKNNPTIKDVLDAMGAFAENVDLRFESIDKRFESIDKRFESIDNCFESIDDRFVSIDQRFESLEKEMRSGFDRIHADLSQIWDELNDIKRRLSVLEKNTIEDSDAHSQEIINLRRRVDYLEKKVKKLELQNK